jgi:hypothetical protein
MPGVAIYRRLPHLWRQHNGYLYIVYSDRGLCQASARRTDTFKVLYEAVITPLTYVIVRRLKAAEGIDHYDRSTNFNPFRLSE